MKHWYQNKSDSTHERKCIFSYSKVILVTGLRPTVRLETRVIARMLNVGESSMCDKKIKNENQYAKECILPKVAKWPN